MLVVLCRSLTDHQPSSLIGLEFTSRILYVVRSVNRNELSLNSVQRIIQYSSEIPWEEADSEKKQPPASWPHDGAIEVSHAIRRVVKGEADSPLI